MQTAGYIGFLYHPSQEDKERSMSFACDVDATTNYGRKRNQKNADIRIQQCYIGKLCELGVEQYAMANGYGIVRGVDWEIYKQGNKSWDSDMVLEKQGRQLHISIKSSPRKYGGRTEYLNGTPIPVELPPQYTYTIQLSDKDGKFGTDIGRHEKYIFCNWDGARKTVEVFAWVDADMVEKLLIRPFSKKLKTIKGCIMMATCGERNGEPLRETPCGLVELINREKKHA